MQPDGKAEGRKQEMSKVYGAEGRQDFWFSARYSTRILPSLLHCHVRVCIAVIFFQQVDAKGT